MDVVDIKRNQMNLLPQLATMSMSKMEMYKKAGFSALAELEKAKLIIEECQRLSIPVYVETPYGVCLYAGYLSQEIKLESIVDWIGEIPDQILEYIINSSINPVNLFVLTLLGKCDPILLLRFYDGKRQSVDNPWIQEKHRYYMEVAQWD